VQLIVQADSIILEGRTGASTFTSFKGCVVGLADAVEDIARTVWMTSSRSDPKQSFLGARIVLVHSRFPHSAATAGLVSMPPHCKSQKRNARLAAHSLNAFPPEPKLIYRRK